MKHVELDLIKAILFFYFCTLQIEREFKALWPNAEDFLGKLSSFYTPRILIYAKKRKPHLLSNS